jgi:hypothetical protein
MTCSTCRHNHGRECRRFPPVLISPPAYVDDEDVPAQWGFPPARARCGEFAPNDTPSQLTE